MSGDFGPRITIPAALAFAESVPRAELQIFGDLAVIQPYLPRTLPDNLPLHDAPGVISMNAAPKNALRQGQGSSMWQALNAVAAGDALACVSAEIGRAHV